MFNWGAALGEGIIASLFLALVSKRKPEFRIPYYGIFLIVEIVLVVLRYSGQENSSFFFWHPYIAFLISDIADFALYRRGCGDSGEDTVVAVSGDPGDVGTGSDCRMAYKTIRKVLVLNIF